jgi:hypothetical protein
LAAADGSAFAFAAGELVTALITDLAGVFALSELVELAGGTAFLPAALLIGLRTTFAPALEAAALPLPLDFTPDFAALFFAATLAFFAIRAPVRRSR